MSRQRDKMAKISRSIASIALAATCGGCWGPNYEGPAAQYVNRSDTITLSAGNAKDINATTHTIDPWPRRVANRRIPGNGERMTHAIGNYRGGPPAANQGPSGPQVIGIPVGAATPTSSPGATGGPPQ